MKRLFCRVTAAVLILVAKGSYLAWAEAPSDSKEFEAFIDPIFAEQMEKQHIPGSTFVMVKDGEIFLMKGYGYADLERKRRVAPDRTLFRVASVSKLFTATAVMQLYEKGLIDLHDDVNKHLKLFKLEAKYPQPVTLANLLTHTGGFDERAIGMDAKTEAQMLPLGEYLAKRMPPRVIPPGEQYSYSNHGMALAGYLVEAVSGIPFEKYVEENILKPLEMNHSSFSQPPPFAAEMATGYVYKRGKNQAVPYDYHNVPPAGAFHTTAADIAHFMIAHLQNGRYGDARILSEETAREMHRRQFGHDPRLPGATYSFYEGFENNQHAIMHAGDIRGYSSLLFLLPEHNIGFFVSSNNNAIDSYMEGPGLREAITEKFLDRYFPVGEGQVAERKQPDLVRDMKRFAGHYRNNRYSRHTIEKLTTLFAQFCVAANDDGTLTIYYPGNYKKPTRWVAIESLVFKQVNGEELAIFREDGKGRITHLLVDTMPIQFSERLGWYETTVFQLGLATFFSLIFLSACAGWPAAALIRRLRKKTPDYPRPARMARFVAGVISFLILLTLIGLAVALRIETYEFVYGVPRLVIGLLFGPFVTTGLTGLLPIFTAQAWGRNYWSFAGRLHYTLVTLAALAFIPFLIYWNLLGFRF
ncbi:serine hydrolase [Candidatus Poribacteria bacterium]|nr:serine hydrolase [Candidatus Poribacteria bacterium]